MSRSQGHETYQQLARYNSATEGRINFKLGENFHCEGETYDTLSKSAG